MVIRLEAFLGLRESGSQSCQRLRRAIARLSAKRLTANIKASSAAASFSFHAQLLLTSSRIASRVPSERPSDNPCALPVKKVQFAHPPATARCSPRSGVAFPRWRVSRDDRRRADAGCPSRTPPARRVAGNPSGTFRFFHSRDNRNSPAPLLLTAPPVAISLRNLSGVLRHLPVHLAALLPLPPPRELCYRRACPGQPPQGRTPGLPMHEALASIAPWRIPCSRVGTRS